ncbi:MAG: hypothetical protein ACR2P5_08085 [Gammaproteobacteria bacterium]
MLFLWRQESSKNARRRQRQKAATPNDENYSANPAKAGFMRLCILP